MNVSEVLPRVPPGPGASEQGEHGAPSTFWSVGAVLPHILSIHFEPFKLLRGILESRESHFLSREGTGMQDFVLKLSKKISGLYPRPRHPRPADSRTAALKIMH